MPAAPSLFRAQHVPVVMLKASSLALPAPRSTKGMESPCRTVAAGRQDRSDTPTPRLSLAGYDARQHLAEPRTVRGPRC